ncbi:MAG: GIY-YIG nuclease family protein [Kiritimatiellae bacterium]|jgi:predicted GIY-YIG superfamily endonuclease|nr:GIY-YIG nuclease family protein [Kiritimatiellia bacterium]
MKWYTYILRCSNGSYYVGHTRCVEKRFLRHVSKSGAKHTAVYAPEQVEYKEEFLSEENAIQRELQIKNGVELRKKRLLMETSLNCER